MTTPTLDIPAQVAEAFDKLLPKLSSIFQEQITVIDFLSLAHAGHLGILKIQKTQDLPEEILHYILHTTMSFLEQLAELSGSLVVTHVQNENDTTIH